MEVKCAYGSPQGYADVSALKASTYCAHSASPSGVSPCLSPSQEFFSHALLQFQPRENVCDAIHAPDHELTSIRPVCERLDRRINADRYR